MKGMNIWHDSSSELKQDQIIKATDNFLTDGTDLRSL